MVEFKGDLRATSFVNKLRWAAYDIKKSRIRSLIKGDGTKKVSGGLAHHEFSLYLELFKDGVEVRYCGQVVKWWKAMQVMGTESRSNAWLPTSAQRTHLPVAEISPHRPPQGFFDCIAC